MERWALGNGSDVLPVLTAEQVAAIMPRAPQPALWGGVLNASMGEFAIDSAVRMAAFLAQVAHESNELRTLVENLNYSAKGLRSTFGKYFPTEEIAVAYAKQPARIASRVYANRLGNGDEASGDGWTFRGRGLLQLTGRSQYRFVGEQLALPLEDRPELLEQPGAAARSAAYFWRSNGLNALADVSGDLVHDDEDFIAITKKVNGGTTGLAKRKEHWAIGKTVLGVV